MKKGFTFIEILVVVTIIALLSAVGAISYSQFTKQSRDAKRKADIEQIRAAVEMYRSNNGQYPLNSQFTFTSCTAPGSVSDGTATYLSKAPNDPKCTASTPSKYYYNALDSSDVTCTALTTCVKYILAVTLENGGTVCVASPSCTSGTGCNYCMGPYGQL